MMKRLAIITVGKTHSGKTTFARELEQKLNNSIVMDQDNQAEFINTYYNSLQPKQGPNTLKHAMSKLIVDYAKKHTNYHLIICNSNRSRKGRSFLLEKLFPTNEFTRILVHFDLPDHVLQTRVINSDRSTNIFRAATSFEEVLKRQQADSEKEDVVNPEEDEADYLFVIRHNESVDFVIKEIIQIARVN